MVIVLAAEHDLIPRRVCRGLEEAGFTVVAVADAMLLLRLLRAARHPALVVLDVTPPGRDLATILPLLVYERFLMPHHAYILCTARPPRLAVALLEKLEGQVLITPFTSAELVRRIAQAAAHLTLRDAVPAQ